MDTVGKSMYLKNSFDTYRYNDVKVKLLKPYFDNISKGSKFSIRYESLSGEHKFKKKAINLSHFSQQKIAEDSACSECKDYDKCRSIKHVCWRDIVKYYGADNWTYPDPTCPKGPIPVFQ